MTSINLIGIDKQKADNLVNKLNQLLADYNLFYQNVHGYHWNISGHKFFELHVKFEELYRDLFEKIDEIAERILALGGTPLHTYEDYAEVSTIKSQKNVSSSQATVNGILEGLKVLLTKQREILTESDEAGDEGTNALMSDYISQQEKLAWMYSSFMG